MRVIFIFVDGLGLGSQDPKRNPCAQEGLDILACFENGDGSTSVSRGGFLVPTDATLGLDGLPQSATGQTTLLTGVNCARLLGRHLQGYPNEQLREVLRERSLLKQIKEMGLRPAFVNAYRSLFFALKEKTRWRLSTTTVATLSAGIPFFQIDDIRQGRSLYHDFTNATLIARGFDVPLFSAEEAGRVLARVAEGYDFVLYEYFLTDRAGHSQEMERASHELRKLECFLSTLLSEVDLEESVVIVTSDHGNVEDLSVKTHTRNRVMTLLWGRRSDLVRDDIRTLEDVAPAVVKLLGVEAN